MYFPTCCWDGHLKHFCFLAKVQIGGGVTSLLESSLTFPSFSLGSALMYLKYFAFHLPMNLCFSGITMQNLNSFGELCSTAQLLLLLIRMVSHLWDDSLAWLFFLSVLFSPRSSKPSFLFVWFQLPYCGCCCYGVVWSFVGLWSLPLGEDFTILLTFLSARNYP